MRNYGVMFAFLSLIIIFASCSKDDKPSGPVTYYQGALSVVNQSDVSVVITEMTQRRGTTQVHVLMGNGLNPGFSLALHDIIDPGGGLIFPGGDIVTVKFASQEHDPNNPSQPLFQNNVQLTINGSLIVQIKSGGSYGIGPG